MVLPHWILFLVNLPPVLTNPANIVPQPTATAMASKRGRTSTNGASPRKRQKSVNGQPEVVEFTTRVLLDPANDKGKSKEETEAEPLLGDLDEHLDRAFYTVTPVIWNTLKKYKRFSSTYG